MKHVTKIQLRNHQIRPAIVSAITIELMTQGVKKRQVLDTTQAFVRQDP